MSTSPTKVLRKLIKLQRQNKLQPKQKQLMKSYLNKVQAAKISVSTITYWKNHG